MARPDPERVWLGFAQAALGGVMSINAEIDPAATTWEKHDGEMADACAAIADEMLERWRLRYDDDAAPPKTTRGVQAADVAPAIAKPAEKQIDW